jgi:hypothetical protein
MLLRLVRPMKRSGSSVPPFAQRVPADVWHRAIGRTLDVPLGLAGIVTIRITDRMASVRCAGGEAARWLCEWWPLAFVTLWYFGRRTPLVIK